MLILLVLCLFIAAFRVIRLRNMDLWLLAYLKQRFFRNRPGSHDLHVLLCIADHFEPRHGSPSVATALARVQKWVRDYPAQFGTFRDSDGRSPRHTFFFPIEEYEPSHLGLLAGLCQAGFGEVELHLHHDNDTAENLRKTLIEAQHVFREKHGLLPKDTRTGRNAYAFIHGNWALDNSRADGRWCGVNNELDILRETGCYADFTYPSAPSATQPPKINSIYYSIDEPDRPASHHRGVDVGLGPAPENGLLLIQGPLILNWRRRRWGVIPTTENGCLQASQPPNINRLDHWLKAGVQVPGRPDWFFIKLYAHGAPEVSHEALLGESMIQFHRDLAARAARDPRFHFHYVSAREMYNLVKAAEDGWTSSVADALNYRLVWPVGGQSGPAS